MTKGYRFIGGARTYTGVKSQDFSPEQFAALGPREQRIVRLSGAWELPLGDDATRAEIDALLTGRGLNPADYRTKADALAALDAPPDTGTGAGEGDSADTGEEG